MIEYVDSLATQMITLIVPLIGIRIILDYARIILFKEW